MRLLGRIETAYSDAFAIYHNLSTPFTLMFAYTKKSNFVSLGCLTHVLKIANSIHFAKIRKSIVLLITIFVVNVSKRVLTCHVKPGESVSKTLLIVDCNCPVSCVGGTSSSFSDKVWATVVCFPCKLPRLRVVIKNSLDMVMCNHESDFTIKVTA